MHSPCNLPHGCVSQVGSSGIRTLSTTSAPLSMGQILEVLLGKAKAEAEEAQVNREGRWDCAGVYILMD